MERPQKLNDFIRAILDEARRNSLTELCEEYDISEAEMNECMEYLRACMSTTRLHIGGKISGLSFGKVRKQK